MAAGRPAPRGRAHPARAKTSASPRPTTKGSCRVPAHSSDVRPAPAMGWPLHPGRPIAGTIVGRSKPVVQLAALDERLGSNAVDDGRSQRIVRQGHAAADQHNRPAPIVAVKQAAYSRRNRSRGGRGLSRFSPKSSAIRVWLDRKHGTVPFRRRRGTVPCERFKQAAYSRHESVQGTSYGPTACMQEDRQTRTALGIDMSCRRGNV